MPELYPEQIAAMAIAQAEVAAIISALADEPLGVTRATLIGTDAVLLILKHKLGGGYERVAEADEWTINDAENRPDKPVILTIDESATVTGAMLAKASAFGLFLSYKTFNTNTGRRLIGASEYAVLKSASPPMESIALAPRRWTFELAFTGEVETL